MFSSQPYNRLSDEERSLLNDYHARVAKCELKLRLSSHMPSSSAGSLPKPATFDSRVDHQCHASYFKDLGGQDLETALTERSQKQKAKKSLKPRRKVKKPAVLSKDEEQKKLLRMFCRHLQHCDALKEELELAGGSSLVQAHLRSK
mmetsp:Transcript_32946/g.57752  ORF Transcript_32946/g.57752 Transcript_32946/m.57752 type:complete len:146 (-) Transcript_32946:3493-3930(-)